MECNYSANFHAVDYYDSDKPAYGKNGTYNGYLFTAKAVTYIQDHVKTNADRPFFLYFALHNTHSPFEAPDKYVSMYKFNQTLRNTFDAMTSVVDESGMNPLIRVSVSEILDVSIFDI